MRRSLVSLFPFAWLAACSAHGPATDAAIPPPCPAAAPSTGDPCASSGQDCFYEHCATDGMITAHCGGADAGTFRWTVGATPCPASCNGTSSCGADTVCIERQSGAQITQCWTRGCGDGPLDCACACGADQQGCQIHGTPDTTGALVTCIVGCGASVCP